MRDLRHRLGEGDGLLHAARGKSCGTDTHRRTVAEAVVGRRVIGDEHPPVEPPAIAAVGIVLPDAPHPVHRIRAQARIEPLLRISFIREPRGICRRRVRCLPLRLHDRLRHGQRHNAVIRRKTSLRKKLKVLAAVIVELKPRADNIANDRPQHRMASFKESHRLFYFFSFSHRSNLVVPSPVCDARQEGTAPTLLRKRSAQRSYRTHKAGTITTPPLPCAPPYTPSRSLLILCVFYFIASNYNTGKIRAPLSQFYSFIQIAENPQKRAFPPLHFFYFSLQCGYCHTRKTQIGRDVL